MLESTIKKAPLFLKAQWPALVVMFCFLIILPVGVMINRQSQQITTNAAGINVLTNGSFESTGTAWSSPWELHINSTGGGTLSQDNAAQTDGLSSALINVTQFTNFWDVQLGQSVALTAGQTYTLTFDAKAATNRSLFIALQQTVSPYTEYYGQEIAVTSSWQQYSFSFTPTVTDANAMLWFNVAQTTGQVWLDNVSLATTSDAQTPTPSSARQFYIDSVLGVDTNSGTSENSPWKTINKVNSMTFVPGDTIHFKRGSTWNQKLLIKSNGVQGNPVTYQAYGTGTAPTLDISSGDGIDVAGSWNIVKDFLLKNMSHNAVNIHADHIVVSDNEITNAGLGVWITGQSNVITRNYAHDLKMIVNTVGGDDDYGAAGYELNNAHNTEISYNKCINCKAPSFDYGTDGGFVEVWQSATNNRIHHNFADNTNGFFEIGGDNPSQIVSNNTISYNLAINTGAVLVVHDSGTFSITPSNLVYDNNTFSGASTIWFASNNPTPGKLIFRNNIVQGGSVPTNGNFTRSNNLYSVQPGFALGQGEKVGNPLFVNSGAKDFHLQTASPAINAGVLLGYTIDYDNNPVPAGSAPDMGAFEFGSAVSQPTSTPTQTPLPTATSIPIATSTPIPTNTPTPVPTNDTIRPTIVITSPINSSIVQRGKAFTITANATDNVAIKHVQFSVTGKGGNLSCLDTTYPYTCSWLIPSKPSTSYTITAIAYDTSNNTASSTIQVQASK